MMQTAILIVVIVLALTALAMIVVAARYLRGSRRHADQQALAVREQAASLEGRVSSALAMRDEIAELARWVQEQQPSDLDLTSLVEISEPPTTADAIVQIVDEDRAVVFADEARALELGTIVGRAAQTVTVGARYASTTVDSAIEAAKRTGYLVELSPESRAAWRAQERIRAAGGYVLGVLRDKDTKHFSHLLKVKPARLAQTAASGAALLSALAGQAQLDQIEKQLGEIASDVNDIKSAMHNRHKAELIAAQRLLGEIYAAARAAETLTPAMWDQIAPLAHVIYTLQEESKLGLHDVSEKLSALARAGVGERREKLRLIANDLERLLDLALSEERSVVQFQLLRVWHLASRRDPSLDHALQEIVRDSNRRRDSLRAVVDAINAASDGMEDVPLLQRPRVVARRDVRETVAKLRELATEHRNTTVTLPMLGAPSQLAIDAATESA